MNTSTAVTMDLAKKIVSTTYENLSTDVIQVTREIALDGMANMLAGSSQPLSGPLLEYARSLGGPAISSVVGHELRTHPVHAAFLNGSFCHALDYEFVWNPPTHPTGPTLPAFLAIAEERGLSGKDIVPAIAVGFEIQGRLRLAIDEAGVGPMDSIHPPGLVGPFGAAAGCAKLLGLDVEKTRMALGIVGSRVSGLGANTGSMTKATHCGNAARMGLESALLAESGFTGNDAILEAPQGYNDIFFSGKLDMDAILRNFGAPYRMVDPGLIYKKYPTMYLTHWSVDAALQLREEYGLIKDDITAVEVEVAADNRAADRWSPQTDTECTFSIPYTVAAALLDGKLDFDTFAGNRRLDPTLLSMVDRIQIVRNPDIPAYDFSKAWSRVTITTRDGLKVSARVDRPVGIWDNPVPWDLRVEKFHDCAALAIQREAAEDALALIERFETLASVDPLMSLVRGQP